MAQSSIHVEALHLYEDIQPVYVRFKKAMSHASNAHKEQSLARVFGSSVDQYVQVVFGYENDHNEILHWRCPLPIDRVDRMFTVSVKELTRESGTCVMTIHENNLYEDVMPLDVREQLHNVWKEQLTHVTALLGKSIQIKTPLYKWWAEDQLLLELGFCTIETEHSEMVLHPLSKYSQSLLRSVLQAVEEESDVARAQWPTLVPWLQMTQMVLPAPQDKDTESWAQWSAQLQSMYLASHSNQEASIALPTDLTGEHAPF